MARYIVTYEIDVADGKEIADVVEAAERGVALARARVGTPSSPHECVVMASTPPVCMRWSVTVMGLERRELMLAWDGEQERGVASVYDPRPRGTEVDVHSILLPPASMAMLLRGAAEMPVDMITTLVARTRRGR